ncbi:MAG: hypothetical protein JNN30_14970, partial [Rhodanobacteraceae bacterium]|nr:hypothetical protein [Rhodanobacteraceae bacterium]
MTNFSVTGLARRLVLPTVAVISLALLNVPAQAQTAPPTYPGVSIPAAFVQGGGTADVPVYVEYNKRLRASEQLSALGSELFGDEVSLYSGQTSFRQVDIDLP